jgi:hypothetical protein
MGAWRGDSPGQQYDNLKPEKWQYFQPFNNYIIDYQLFKNTEFNTDTYFDFCIKQYDFYPDWGIIKIKKPLLCVRQQRLTQAEMHLYATQIAMTKRLF